QCGSAVGDGAGAGGGDGAVLAESGPEAGDLGRIAAARLLVLRDLDFAFTGLDRDRHDLARETAVCYRLAGAIEGFDGVVVLRVAAEAVVVGGVLGEGAHGAALVVGIFQAVEQHMVDHLAMAEAIAAAGAV